MRDLSSRTFDRTGTRRPDRSTIQLLCPKAQQTPFWRRCRLWLVLWCRRRPRRPREPERVPDARRHRTHRPITLRHTPPPKTRRQKKMLPLQTGETGKGRPPQLGRPKGPRRGGLSFRTALPPPPMVKTSGCPGPSPWGSRKYSDTRVTHSIPLFHCFP